MTLNTQLLQASGELSHMAASEKESYGSTILLQLEGSTWRKTLIQADSFMLLWKTLIMGMALLQISGPGTEIWLAKKQ